MDKSSLIKSSLIFLVMKDDFGFEENSSSNILSFLLIIS
jgi:hypothetical protein